MLRSSCRALAVLLLFSGCATDTTRTGLSPAAPEPDQILWQRTLEDALAIAKVRHQPLLLAVNMDGESASDRIYSERYRDPAFVAATRHCVCLGASVFRHNPRDHDDQGRRIPCPRFHEITCGEHIALEPVLWEKYLSDGERVAPRHALVRPDGTKAWDLSLCFDLQDVDRALFASVQGAAANDTPVPQEHRARLAAEDAVVNDVPGLWLVGVAKNGDSSAVEAFHRLVPRLHGAYFHPAQPVAETFVPAVVACGLTATISRDVWDTLQRASTDRANALFATLEKLAAAEPSSWFQVYAHRALSAPEAPSLASLLAEADTLTTRLHGSAPMARDKGDGMPDVPTLERELDDVEKLLAKTPDDASLHARFAKASLDLGRQALDAQKKNARFLLEDAATHWKKAIARDAGRYEWWIESARSAYFLTDFANESECGRRALALATNRPLGELPTSALTLDARAAEALRWIGDAAARRLGDLAPTSPDAPTLVREALLAYGLVAASEHADASDMGSFASVCGALSCHRAEQQAAEAGATRFPTSNDLRAAITRALWASGRIGDAPAVAARIEQRAPCAESAWFTGQAFLFAAEDCRRRDDLPGALTAYSSAAEKFAACAAQSNTFLDDCSLRIATCWFGRGMALVRTADRVAAADCLERAIARNAAIRDQRDGLGYDCLDLVDRLLEWRDVGGESPVTAAGLADRLAKVSAAAFWPTAIADACIREGLRADGRNPERVEKDTVDAGGKPIRDKVGLPTARGDEWFAAAIAIARRAQTADADAAAKTVLAQGCTIAAERQLERGRIDGVQANLTEAATVLGLDAPAAAADVDALRRTAATLRAQLGAQRPRFREGR